MASKKIQTGLLWGVFSYIIFTVLALAFVILAGNKIVAENVSVALKFALYGGLGGLIFGYIEQEKREEVSTYKKSNVSAPPREHGGIASFVKFVESIFALLKLIVVLAIIAAVAYIYVKYFRR